MSETQQPGGEKRRDSIGNTLFVAISLSLVCSLLVASTAVLLKPKQQKNREQYRQTIILDVAGLLEPGANIEALFATIESRVVILASGEFIDSIDTRDFDAHVAANDPALSIVIPDALDLAYIRRRAIYAPVYIIRKDGRIEQVILPVYGAGLWSTMYGYLAVAGDGATVRALRFYEHAETPGLGDQIDDAEWRAQWSGKQLYGPDGLPRIEVMRGIVRTGDDESSQIDALSGATLTGRGVTNLVRYWTGPHGFGPFLGKLQDESDGSE
jgi:Na+-transporting NADH:ubiquinone oxidoreductase subunit C